MGRNGQYLGKDKKTRCPAPKEKKMRKLAAGNWKMNGTRASLSEVKAINAELDDTDPAVVICPPVSLGVGNALTKDYSGLMKAINKKKGRV